MPSGLRVNIRKLDTHKIKELAARGARIFVGFSSGDVHVEKKTGENTSDNQLIDMADLARDLSVGTATIPARPFLEEGILSKKDEIKAEIKKQAENFVETGKANYHKVGTMAVEAVQEFVRGDYYRTNVPNAPSTIKQKSKEGKISDKPLIDTVEMINSVHYLIVPEKDLV